MIELIAVTAACGLLFYLTGQALHDCDLDYDGLVFVMAAITSSLIFIAVSTIIGV
jgi:hypothetical protein